MYLPEPACKHVPCDACRVAHGCAIILRQVLRNCLIPRHPCAITQSLSRWKDRGRRGTPAAVRVTTHDQGRAPVRCQLLRFSRDKTCTHLENVLPERSRNLITGWDALVVCCCREDTGVSDGGPRDRCRCRRSGQVKGNDPSPGKGHRHGHSSRCALLRHPERRRKALRAGSDKGPAAVSTST